MKPTPNTKTFRRFTAAMQTILTVSKTELLAREKRAKESGPPPAIMAFEGKNQNEHLHPFMHPRDEILATMERIYEYRMTTTSGGNLSIREDNGDIWITPTRSIRARCGATNGLGP